MPIPEHPDWPTLRQHLRLEEVHANGPERYRLEVVRPADTATQQWLLTFVYQCCACGKPFLPVRGRKTWDNWYYHVSCSTACRNGKAAKAEVRAIVADLLGNPPPTPQLSLFGDDDDG